MKMYGLVTRREGEAAGATFYINDESPDITIKVYAHFFREALAKASESIGEVLLE